MPDNWVIFVLRMATPKSRQRRRARAALIAALAGVPVGLPIGQAQAGNARVAVATNFRDAALEIGSAFQAESGHTVDFSFGSTGQLFAQIAFGAPFDVFLAADKARATQVIDQGFGVAGSQFTYALGRIVLFSTDPALVSGPGALTSARFARLAIAEPTVAPYGAAAVEAMRRLRAHDQVKGKIVNGLSVAQAYQFVKSGNADLGFVALSQVARHSEGSRWIVPEDMHAPISQDAVLLRRGAGNVAGEAFLMFLAAPEAEAILERYGYGRAK